MHDNVGFIDSYFTNCKFFKDENYFFSYLSKSKIDYAIICSPSYLHFKHIKKSLLSKCNVIVEKPPLLNSYQLNIIEKLEKTTKKNCHCIFQLREDKRLIKLKKKLQIKKTINTVKINYFTKRGLWYQKSWKNNKKLSGGLLINIGIHFVDILIWLFGDLKKIKILKKNNKHIKGEFILDYAKVDWDLSISNINKSYNKKKYHREMTINKHKINFNKFNNLHLDNYKSIIFEKKYRIGEFKDLLKNIDDLKI